MLANNNPARTRKVSTWNMWNVELTKKCIMAWIFALLLEYHGAELGWTWQESHLERVWCRQQTMSCLQIRKEGTSCREVDARSHARQKKPGDLWWFRDISTYSYLMLSCLFFLCGACCIVYSGDMCGTSTAQVQEGEQTLLQRSVVLEPYESQTFQHLVGYVNPVLGVSEHCN